jgi:hypothetical protein
LTNSHHPFASILGQGGHAKAHGSFFWKPQANKKLMRKTKHGLTSMALGLLLAGPSAWAQTGNPIEILPVPGKQICGTVPSGEPGASINRELCVTQGNFAHDVYVVKIDGVVALKGVDDETSIGITSTFKASTIKLQCSAQNLPGNVTLEEVQQALPGRSLAKAKELVELMKDSAMGVEVARLCAITIDGIPQPKVQVIFD